MEVNKDTLIKFIKDELERLNDIHSYNMGFVNENEIEPKLELLRQLNYHFSLGLDKEQIKDYYKRNEL